MIQHMRTSARNTFTAATLAIVAGSAFGQVSFEHIPPIIASDASWGYAVSSDGTWVTGRSGTNYYYGSSGHGYRWSHNSGTEDLDPLVGESTGYGISGDGQTVVGYENQGSRGWRAFIWDPVNGLNHVYRNGMLLGVASDASHCVGYETLSNSPSRAVRWVMGDRTPQFLDNTAVTSSARSTATSADGSVVFGNAYYLVVGKRAFRWTEAAGMVMISGGANSISTDATGLSGDGSIMVGSTTDSGSPSRTHAYRWIAATGMTRLLSSDPALDSTIASGISSDGSTVVGKGHPALNSFTTSAFIWRADIGMQKLDTVLAAVLPPSWHVTEANAASANGSVIVGTATNQFGQPQSFIATIGTCVAPVMVTQPADTHVCKPHQTVQLTAEAGGFAPFTYQWQIADATAAGGWRTLSDSPAHILGSNVPTLSILDATNADSGSYRCLINNSCGGTSSNEIALSVCTGDFNCDSSVDFFDYLDFVSAFSAGLPAADFNADGSTDFFDYLDMVDNFSLGC
jgi:hypothetical protein